MIDDVEQILAENDYKIEEIKPADLVPVPPPPKPVILPKTPKIKVVPEIIHVDYKSKFLEAKKEYLSDRDIKAVYLARKYKIDPIKLQETIKEENWDKQRLEVYVKADEKARQILATTLAEVKGRHILMSRMLQRLGKQSLKKIQPGELSAKEALSYVTEGVRMEREAHGMDKQSPKIVNIIAMQQKILEKYKTRHGKEE
jgi:hypothetical protein